MPVYEYDCPKCGVIEVTQRITEDPLKKCPTCRRKVSKLISLSSFSLKGSGWYVTDYGGKKVDGPGDNGKDEKAEKPAKSETPKVDAKKAGSKSDSSKSASTSSS